MDKLQFLDLTDLNPGESDQLEDFLYNEDYLEVVELPPDGPPTWEQHPVPYQPESLGMTEQMDQAPVDYSMMVPQTVQFTPQMMPGPSVYVSSVTANVNVHGPYMSQPMPYAFMAQQDAQGPVRKLRPSKTPPKRSPEVRSNVASHQTTPFTPPFTQAFPHMTYPFHTPTYYIPTTYPPLTRLGAGPPVAFSPTAVYVPTPPVFSPPHHLQQPPSEPEDIPVPYLEPEEKLEEPEYHLSEEEEQVVLEESQPTIEEIIPVIEVKLDKPLVNKAPPATAFKSAHNLNQKPPFTTVTTKQKRSSVDTGPEFVEPPVETGPPKKSYASLFGSGDRASAQMPLSDPAASKPLATVHPTVHNNVSSPVARSQQNCVDKPALINSQESTTVTFSNTVKAHQDKIMMPDYDINLQRLGEFLENYQLDHRPLLMQPRGLTNRSNYCYINAILQALVACPPFCNLMRALPPSQAGNKSRTPIIDSMAKFVNEFSPMSLNTRPVGRKEKAQANKEGNMGGGEVVTGPAFEPAYVYKTLSEMHAAFPVEGRQEDAEEFLSCLLNGLNDEMLEAMKLVEPQSNGLTNGDVTTNGEPTTNGDYDTADQDHEWTEVINKSNKSVVTRRAEFGHTPLSAIFRGQMRSKVFRAGVENGNTANVQPFFTLQLDVEKASSVEKALELLVGKDEVFGGTCPKTNQEISMYTQTSLEELPIILLLHLKCFDYKLHTCSKIIKTVEFPVDLKIDTKLLTSKSKTSSKDRQYKLLAVVYHDGKEATKGHYITDVYHMGYSGWVRYDDASVRPVTQHQVLNPRSPRVPYLLYYRRCDTIGLPDKNR